MTIAVRWRRERPTPSGRWRARAVACGAPGLAAAVLGSFLALLAPAALPSPSLAGCTTIPERPVEFVGRGARIDRGYIAPGDPVRITIDRPDDAKAGSTAAQGVDRVKVQVLVKPLTESEAPQTVLVASPDVDEDQPCWFLGLFCPAARSDVHQVHLTTMAVPGALLLSFNFAPTQNAAGPALVAIAAAEQAIPESLGRDGCDSEAGRSLIACIDEISPAATVATVAATPTALVLLAKDNDFRDACSHDVDAPHCTGNAASVCFTTNGAGDALFRMKWSGVLRPKGPDYDRRKVQGSSPVQAFPGAGRITVPNDDFLDSTDASGTGFGTKPQFVAIDIPGRPNELTLSGRTDKGMSILRIRRRRPANRCAGGPQANQLCIADGACPSSTCTALAKPVFFTCSNADRPCTRQADCPGGSCSAGSTCRTAAGSSTGVSCLLDKDCGKHEECGPGLFEFRGRDTAGVVCIPREIQPGTDFAGVCDDGANQGQLCSAVSPCPAPTSGSVDCVGFRAAALDYE